MSENSMHCPLEGSIAAGKSHLGYELHKTGRLVFLAEPVDQWRTGFANNLLHLLYSNAERWSFTFQIVAFITRIKAQEAAREQADGTVVLTERSICGDRYIFAELAHLLGNMDDAEKQIYDMLWDLWASRYGLRPSVTFYLRTPADLCLERIAQRGRPEEKGIDRSFVRQLEELHDNWLLASDYDGTVIVLDGRKPVANLVAEVLAHIP